MSFLASLRATVVRVAETLRRAIGRETADDALREEMSQHLEMHIAENIRRGMSPQAARRDALIAAGGLTLAAEAVRERRGLAWIEELGRDIWQARRALAAQPGYVAAVLLTLALGIGANTAMFTVVDAVVLHPLSYPQPDRLLSLSVGTPESGDMHVVDEHTFRAWSAARSVVMTIYMSAEGVMSLPSGPEEIQGTRATPGYFEVMGVRPLAGRSFVSSDSAAGAAPVIVLSQQLRERIAGRGPILGSTVLVDDRPMRVIGVMPSSFTTQTGPQYWMPERIRPSSPGATYFWTVMARLRNGATIENARAELAALTPRRAEWRADGSHAAVRPVVMTLADRRFGDQRKPLLILFGAVAVLLVIACANLANLALVRAAGRQREMAVRLVLGAGRWRVARALLVESLVLAVGGAVLGIALSIALVKYFVHLSPASVGNPSAVHVNAAALMFTLVLTMASGVAFGFVPALVASRGDLARSLSSGTPRASATKRQHLVRRLLVTGQLALALVLLTGAGIVARSFWRVTSIDLGFQDKGLLSVEVRLTSSNYTDARIGAFFEEMAARVRRLRGVQSVAFADARPLSSNFSASYVARDSAWRLAGPIYEARIGVGDLETVGAHLVSGRAFTSDDLHGAPRVILSASLARRLFPAGNPVGKTMAGPNGKSTIVGVVRDIRSSVDDDSKAPVYLPLSPQELSPWNYLMVRTSPSADPAAIETEIAQVVHAIDPRLARPAFTQLSDAVAKAFAPRAFIFVLLSLFAGIAGVLALIGLYGVLSRIVTDRTREIGIRVALGAERRGVIWLVLIQGLVVALAGVALGLGASASVVRLMRSIVYQTDVYDPWTFVVAAGALVGVSLIASYLPARRATRIDPVIALRSE